MGKKVSPHSLRLGITRTWDSLWFDKRGYKTKFLQDIALRKFLKKECEKAGVSKIEIYRSAIETEIIVHCAKPGLIIGRSGENIDVLKKKLDAQFKDGFKISVQEIRKPDADANIVAQSVAEQVSRRFPYRRVIKMAVDRAKEGGVKGIRITAGGRLNGVDIARSETYSFGTVPLHTLRAKIDYATSRAETMYGTIGIKVWVYHGLVFKNEKLNTPG